MLKKQDNSSLAKPEASSLFAKSILAVLLGGLVTTIVFAATPTLNESANTQQCNPFRQQMHQNHIAIDKAYDKQDACTMGKLMIQNRQIFESHLECFPRRNKNQPHPVPAPFGK